MPSSRIASTLFGRIRSFFSQHFTTAPEPYRYVEPPPDFAGSKVAYRQGYNDDHLDNPYEPGTINYESWKLGAARRGKDEMGIL